LVHREFSKRSSPNRSVKFSWQEILFDFVYCLAVSENPNSTHFGRLTVINPPPGWVLGHRGLKRKQRVVFNLSIFVFFVLGGGFNEEKTIF